ncbi:diguanylate cyclase [Sulfurimonas lithotrophica]|uniref:Diguanylate cyclase n=1 Tax=Sulfurimonas lithotrophica TaxID=2590022 RepID=A0A5P8P3B1_9BACT|nr:CHASE domain-containing protein [Sulfurimonas lithotrophica]QFR50174.1 diguanylate cyclase [Sulfurimonas lithotrophica]
MPIHFNKSHKVWPIVTIIIGLLFSALSGWLTYNYYKEKENLRLDLASNEIILLVQNRMAAYEQVLKSGVGLFNASDMVSRKEWTIFVKEHKLNENFKGIQGFGYSEVVLPQNKHQHEERIRKEGFADFKIYPDGKRELYTSIIYLEPFDERNIRAFGYDMFSEKIRRIAMKKAMLNGKAALSGKIKLVQEFNTDIQAGFLMYLPVYKKGYKLDTPQERALAIQGFVYAPFRANDLMNGILGKMFPNIDFEIYDGDSIAKDNILYSSNSNNKSKLYKKTNITMNGHTWTLIFKTNSVFKSENIYVIFLIPSLILILTFLLYSLLNSLIKTEKNAVQIAKKATQKLQNSEERLRYALEGAGDGLWDWNLVTDEVFFSKRWKKMLGFSEDEIGSDIDEWKSLIHPEDLEHMDADITAHIEGKRDTYKNEHRVKCKDGSYKWILDRGIIVSRSIDGTPLRMVGSQSDISERKQSQLKLAYYLEIIDKNVISSTTDLHGKITKVSQAFSDISGYSKNELLGKSHNILRHKDMPSSTYKELWKTIQSGNIWEGEIKNKRKDGSTYWVDATISPVKNEQGETINYTSIRHDITDKKRIEELSVTDKLTQLYNRLKLDEIFSMKLASARRYNSTFSIIMMDIDYFKSVNDTWGHQAGDDILKEFATIIKNNIRETDVVGRWGGEEFLILSSESDLESAIKLSEKLRDIVSLFKFSFAGHKTASFGVSSYHAGDDEKTMVKRADDALYRAKENGRNRVEVEKYD